MMLIMMAATGIAMIALGFCIQRMGAATEQVAKGYEIRYTSYLLADELRQSSDDLTRLARTYVISGEHKWKEQYQEVLDIRAGKRARPAQYHKIYWDLRAADIHPSRGQEPAIALADLMKQVGFTDEEFEKLREAERNSDDLVRTETLAMNMVGRGNIAGQSAAPIPATPDKLMHDENYHKFKARIMQPLDDFFTAVDLRTQHSIEAAEANEEFWYAALISIAVALLVLLVGSLSAAYRQLSQSLNEAVRVSDAIASGDLAVDVIQTGPREVASLLSAMSTMRTQLAEVVCAVRQNANVVATACADIAQGNGDLSSRTQEQASALQQSAASMEELSATVHRNADSAEQADKLSRDAATIAVRGGDVVGKVVDTMKSITESSSKIADIIGVIDSIAFQTNLLALNAAVEAARAGEQGRGFAVVASEVRHLAQRSAEAAKQISTLILDSVERVDRGKVLVEQAGGTMTELLDAIKRVTDIMGEISAASAEQSSGVTQISQAVAQMDDATQQNAALVEESAAAAEILKEQARQLVAAMAVFNVADSGVSTGAFASSRSATTAGASRLASHHLKAAA
jgi:methyl-accepting chemotaxis protein